MLVPRPDMADTRKHVLKDLYVYVVFRGPNSTSMFDHVCLTAKWIPFALLYATGDFLFLGGSM